MEQALTALLAPVAGGRRYWGRAPQNASRPFVIMNVVDGAPSYHMQGSSGYTPYRVQLDCYADTYTATAALASSVKALFSGYVGGLIQAIFIESERNLPAADAGEVTTLFRTSIDITVHYRSA
jgi:hypothetical protein